jgi:AcrR family transcriptional regulator
VKEPLSRDAIVSEALRQLTTNGLDGMSLRKVAKALDTGPASLYAYVEDLNELHALVLDRALAKVNLRDTPNTNWRERVHSVLESYARVLIGSPGLAQLAFGTVAVGPNALRIVEKLLALLEEGGVDVATGAWAVDLLGLYVTAIAAEKGNSLDSAAPQDAVEQAINTISERDQPHLHAARAELLSGTGEERFSWAVDVLLNGIAQSGRLSQTRSRSATAKPRTRRRR